jgi:hypothetical protein
MALAHQKRPRLTPGWTAAVASSRARGHLGTLGHLTTGSQPFPIGTVVSL